MRLGLVGQYEYLNNKKNIFNNIFYSYLKSLE